MAANSERLGQPPNGTGLRLDCKSISLLGDRDNDGIADLLRQLIDDGKGIRREIQAVDRQDLQDDPGGSEGCRDSLRR